MTVVSLDPGSVMGFAVSSPSGVSSGTLNFKKKNKFADSGFMALHDFLYTFVADGPYNHTQLEIIVEKPHCGRFMAANRILFGLLAIVHLFCDKYGIKLTEYSPKAIKKFWAGRGNAKKEDMVLETQKKFPNVKDHNQSDAIALLYLHLERTK